MADNPTRIIGLSCLLVCVWIVTYWLWTPLAARVTLGEHPGPLPAPSQEPTAPVTREIEPPPPPLQQPSTGETRSMPRLLAPQFREYTVQPGDTSFEKIAERREVFGDARRGEAIARANKFADPTRLKPGVTVLRIPLDPENIEGKVVQVTESGDAPPVIEPAPAAAPAVPPAPMRTYTLKQGDTLWNVAKKFYGKGALWKHIADANTDTIPRPDHPPVGATIRIPPEPENKPDKVKR